MFIHSWPYPLSFLWSSIVHPSMAGRRKSWKVDKMSDDWDVAHLVCPGESQITFSADTCLDLYGLGGWSCIYTALHWWHTHTRTHTVWGSIDFLVPGVKFFFTVLYITGKTHHHTAETDRNTWITTAHNNAKHDLTWLFYVDVNNNTALDRTLNLCLDPNDFLNISVVEPN